MTKKVSLSDIYHPEAGYGGAQLLGFVAEMRQIEIAKERLKRRTNSLSSEIKAAGFKLPIVKLAYKRRMERAAGLPWQQLTPVPPEYQPHLDRYEAILMAQEDSNAV